MYTCKACGAKVIVQNGKIYRKCKCTGTVIADMKVEVKGSGKLSQS